MGDFSANLSRTATRGSRPPRRGCWLLAAIAIFSVHAIVGADSGSVYVTHKGLVSLAPFACKSQDSSIVQKICYDSKTGYLLVGLSGRFYHYCAVPREVVDAWRQAESKGRFYNQEVKSRYDCRVTTPPY